MNLDCLGRLIALGFGVLGVVAGFLMVKCGYHLGGYLVMIAAGAVILTAGFAP